jgi:2'-5' RNA ligase
MPRHRLGVVLLIPRHISQEIDGLRRALGVSPIERVPPHITLVPPISVAVDDLDDAIALARRVAAEEQPIHVVLGPVDTFNPITPVVYLRVSGPGLDAIKRLRDGLDAGPFAQELAHPFVPHVTLSDDATDREIEGALASLTHYVEHVVLDTVTVLKEDDDRIYRPIGDAPLGGEMTTRVVGADPVTISVTEYPTHRGATMGRYRSLTVEAFVDGHVVGVARGHVAPGDIAWLDELVVIRETRSTGIGGTLARAFADAARAAQAKEIRAVRGATIAGFLVRLGFVAGQGDEFVLTLSSYS